MLLHECACIFRYISSNNIISAHYTLSSIYTCIARPLITKPSFRNFVQGSKKIFVFIFLGGGNSFILIIIIV